MWNQAGRQWVLFFFYRRHITPFTSHAKQFHTALLFFIKSNWSQRPFNSNSCHGQVVLCFTHWSAQCCARHLAFVFSAANGGHCVPAAALCVNWRMRRLTMMQFFSINYFLTIDVLIIQSHAGNMHFYLWKYVQNVCKYQDLGFCPMCVKLCMYSLKLLDQNRLPSAQMYKSLMTKLLLFMI